MRRPGEYVVCSSRTMREVHEIAERVAPRTLNVVITGEPGVGRTALARRVHELSGRCGRLVEFGADALHEDRAEAYLFGHERGAYTDAHESRAGAFERAHEGTLLIRNVHMLSPAVQAKLLRVLQEGTFHRVGAREETRVDVRVIATTGQDGLEAARGFREDLRYRLEQFAIHVPPLRARRSDIRGLAAAFLHEASEGRTVFAEEALRALSRRPWPGNASQLRSTISALNELTEAPIIGERHLDDRLLPLPAPSVRDVLMRAWVSTCLVGGHALDLADELRDCDDEELVELLARRWTEAAPAVISIESPGTRDVVPDPADREVDGWPAALRIAALLMVTLYREDLSDLGVRGVESFLEQPSWRGGSTKPTLRCGTLRFVTSKLGDDDAYACLLAVLNRVVLRRGRPGEKSNQAVVPPELPSTVFLPLKPVSKAKLLASEVDLSRVPETGPRHATPWWSSSRPPAVLDSTPIRDCALAPAADLPVVVEAPLGPLSPQSAQTAVRFLLEGWTREPAAVGFCGSILFVRAEEASVRVWPGTYAHWLAFGLGQDREAILARGAPIGSNVLVRCTDGSLVAVGRSARVQGNPGSLGPIGGLASATQLSDLAPGSTLRDLLLRTARQELVAETGHDAVASELDRWTWLGIDRADHRPRQWEAGWLVDIDEEYESLVRRHDRELVKLPAASDSFEVDELVRIEPEDLLELGDALVRSDTRSVPAWMLNGRPTSGALRSMARLHHATRGACGR